MTKPQDPEGQYDFLKPAQWIDSCDNCKHQEEGRHYCLRNSVAIKNMDTVTCNNWCPKSEDGFKEKIKEANTPAKYLPCPFCGSSDIDPEAVLARSLDGTEKHHAGCMDCGATTDRDWNDRTGAIPESFIRSMKDMEEGRVHDMEKVLSEPPPFDTIERVERITKAAKKAWNKATPEEREALAKSGAEKMSEAPVKDLGFYSGIEWFACWLLDHAEGETISEEQLRPWAVRAWKDHLDDRDRAAPVKEELNPLPCPLCGGRPSMHDYSISCSCGMEWNTWTQPDYEARRRELIEAWNRRAPVQDNDALRLLRHVEELKEREAKLVDAVGSARIVMKHCKELLSGVHGTKADLIFEIDVTIDGIQSLNLDEKGKV